ncbi:hypothetical protein GIB67_041548 [Kingdonia uniflora]|uniref:DUF7906 domain-containing protein n=1 Tax=Kingdonia uniflora TaxID=39325 RepID=A0A7J7MQI7_9MAGN|nr:hypothetical protein GIB67_041548 [Kingdonia uniflora]
MSLEDLEEAANMSNIILSQSPPNLTLNIRPPMSLPFLSYVSLINSFKETMIETEYFSLSPNDFSDDDDDEIKYDYMESSYHYMIACKEFVDDDICTKVKKLEYAELVVDVINLSFPSQSLYESPRPYLEPHPPDTNCNVKNYGTVEIPRSDVKLINPNRVCWVVKIEEDEDGFAFKRGRDEFVRALLTNVDESNKEKIGDNVHAALSSRESSGSSVHVIVFVDNDEGKGRDNGKSDVFVQAESDSWQQMHDINGIVKRMEEGSKPTFCSIVNNVGQLNSALVTAIRQGDWENISDTRDDENVLWQVDVDMMEVFSTSLVEYLKIEDAYNILILNPKHNIKRQRYGYRRDTNIVEWSNICLDALNNVEKLYQGKETADILYSKIMQLMNGKNEDMQLLQEKEFNFEKLAGVHAECLTDTWMGKDRWAFIDLSPGPFSWGPSVGGEGVYTEVSLPNVEKANGTVAEITKDEAEDYLQGTIQERFLVLGNKDHQTIDIILPWINIYELFALKHYKGREAKLALCEWLDERMRDLKNVLQSFKGEEYDKAHKRKVEEA